MRDRVVNNRKGFTLVELIIVVAIIGILAAIGVPAYIGQQTRAERSEGFGNLEALRLLEEQFFAENARYTGNAANTAAVQGLLPGFQPGNNPKFNYSIAQNQDIAGNGQNPCFWATATGLANTRVTGEVYNIDCNNNKDY